MTDSTEGKQGPEHDHQSLPEAPGIHPLLPAGGVSILHGASLLGKTALIATWIRRILDAKSLFGIPLIEQPAEIAVVISDRSRQQSLHWFRVAGVLDSIRIYCMQDDLNTKWELIKRSDRHLLAFKDVVGKFGGLPRRTLLIVDPISIFLGGKLGDYSHTAATIGPINQFIAQQGWTCLGNHHTKKLSRDPKDRTLRPQDRVLGSTAITGYSYSSLYLIGPEELGRDADHPADHYVLGYMAHDLPSNHYRFKRDDRGLFTVADPRLMRRNTTGEPAPVLDFDLGRKVEEFYNVFFAGDTGHEPHSLVTTAFFKLKHSKATVYRYLTKLEAAGRVENVDGKWQRSGVVVPAAPAVATAEEDEEDE